MEGGNPGDDKFEIQLSWNGHIFLRGQEIIPAN
jgi:hypothetical protein